MKVTSVPHIRHGQKINQKQARRFLMSARAWLENANQRIANLRNASPSMNFILERAGNIRDGLLQIERNLEWLKQRGFQDRGVELLLKKTLERMEDLFECRNGHR